MSGELLLVVIGGSFLAGLITGLLIEWRYWHNRITGLPD